MNLKETIFEMKPRDKIKVTLESGAYFSGTAKSVKKELNNYFENEVKSVHVSFVPKAFKRKLQKQTDIFI